jgi:hypothetical protein
MNRGSLLSLVQACGSDDAARIARAIYDKLMCGFAQTRSFWRMRTY